MFSARRQVIDRLRWERGMSLREIAIFMRRKFSVIHHYLDRGRREKQLQRVRQWQKATGHRGRDKDR